MDLKSNRNANVGSDQLPLDLNDLISAVNELPPEHRANKPTANGHEVHDVRSGSDSSRARRLQEYARRRAVVSVQDRPTDPTGRFCPD